MIKGNLASLTVHSDVKTVADISRMLDLEPDDWGDKGDLTRGGRAGRGLAPKHLHHQQTYWSLTESGAWSPTEPGGAIDDDQTGFSALRALVAKLTPRAHAFEELRRGGKTILSWSGDSDSTQGGFVLQADLIRQLAQLGCDLFGTAYLDEDAKDDD